MIVRAVAGSQCCWIGSVVAPEGVVGAVGAQGDVPRGGVLKGTAQQSRSSSSLAVSACGRRKGLQGFEWSLDHQFDSVRDVPTAREMVQS
jgi:hypothetical protein